MFCLYINSKGNCSDHIDFAIAKTEALMENSVYPILNNPTLGKVIEDEISVPPCSNEAIVEKFEIKEVCEFQKQLSNSKEGFLKLMKFTKQSPVYMEDEEEYRTIFENANKTLHTFGYAWRKDKVKC